MEKFRQFADGGLQLRLTFAQMSIASVCSGTGVNPFVPPWSHYKAIRLPFPDLLECGTFKFCLWQAGLLGRLFKVAMALV